MSKNFNPERLLQVLVAPQISEKATYIADKNEPPQRHQEGICLPQARPGNQFR